MSRAGVGRVCQAEVGSRAGVRLGAELQNADLQSPGPTKCRPYRSRPCRLQTLHSADIPKCRPTVTWTWAIGTFWTLRTASLYLYLCLCSLYLWPPLARLWGAEVPRQMQSYGCTGASDTAKNLQCPLIVSPCRRHYSTKQKVSNPFLSRSTLCLSYGGTSCTRIASLPGVVPTL